MINEEKIKFNIESLLATNAQLLEEIQLKSRAIEPKNADTENFVNSVANVKNSKILDLSNVDYKSAKLTYEEIRALHKRIQDNCTAIKELSYKLDPVELSGEKLHDFLCPILLYKKFFKSSVLTHDFDVDLLDAYVNNAKALNVNYITVRIKIDVDNNLSNDALLSDIIKNKVFAAITKFTAANINIILEPEPVFSDSSTPSQWNPENATLWFASWENILSQIADIANENFIPIVCVGANFDLIETNEDNWVQLINSFKTKYSGLITYRTNWWITDINDPSLNAAYEVKLNNIMFNEVDFISVSGYFELTQNINPTLTEIQSAWSKTTKNNRQQNIIKEINNFYTKWKKPIFIGDIGYVDRVGTTTDPQNEIPSETISEDLQKNAYQAFLNVIKSLTYIIGFGASQISNTASNYYLIGKAVQDTIKNSTISR